jgi:hypothetical protein
MRLPNLKDPNTSPYVTEAWRSCAEALYNEISVSQNIHTHTHTHIHTHTVSRTHTHTQSVTHVHTQCHARARTHTHAHSYASSHTYTPNHALSTYKPTINIFFLLECAGAAAQEWCSERSIVDITAGIQSGSSTYGCVRMADAEIDGNL